MAFEAGRAGGGRAHPLEHGAELTTARNNHLQASLSTTSIYLHTDEEKPAKQLGADFAMRDACHWPVGLHTDLTDPQ